MRTSPLNTTAATVRFRIRAVSFLILALLVAILSTGCNKGGPTETKREDPGRLADLPTGRHEGHHDRQAIWHLCRDPGDYREKLWA